VRLTHVPLGHPDANGRGEPAGNEERRDSEDYATVVRFDGGPAEQAVRTQEVQVAAPADPIGDWSVFAPVTERGEVIGLLELTLPREPGTETLTEVRRMAHLLGFVVIANRRHTDLFEWGQRTRPLSLSAEIQQRLLPGPRTCEAGAFTLAGWLEPAADIAGDTFDYSLGRDALHLSMTDAMGHGVAAALTATLCVGGLRGARRQGASPVEQATATNTALAQHASGSGLDDFVTGLVGRLDLRSARLELVNAGHVAPYLLRDAEVSRLELPADVPFGMFADTAYRSTEFELVPGDRLVIVTDGMLERNAAGIDLPGAIRDTRSLHPREAVRALADSALEATGHALSDDATVLCIDWLGEHGGSRRSVAGADQQRASRPLR
jgi:serine phosphatase RsbU (regulator of sigma subunit)